MPGYAGTPPGMGLGSISDRSGRGFFGVSKIRFLLLAENYYSCITCGFLLFFLYQAFINFKVNELLNASFTDI